MSETARRRGLMGRKHFASRLPPEYQEVAWVGKNEVGPRISFSYGNIGAYDVILVFEQKGYAQGASPYGRIAYSSQTNDYYLQMSSSGELTKYGNNFSINSVEKIGYKYTAECTVSVPSGSGNFNLFFPGSSYKTFVGKIFSLKMIKNAQIIHELVPCYRVSDSAIGFYDLNTGAFSTNSGTGNLTKGRKV